MKSYMSGSHSSSFSVIFFGLVLAALPLALAGCYHFTTVDVPGASTTSAFEKVICFIGASLLVGA
jgi:hypothetical protein